MTRLVIKTLLISLLRFVAIMGLVIFVQHFEVSPLPDWTLTLFAYLMQILITYLAARWVFRKRTPGTRETIVVAAMFVLLEILYESGLYLYLTDYYWSGLPGNFQWPTLLISALYVVTVAGAAWQARKKNIIQVMPEGMEG